MIRYDICTVYHIHEQINANTCISTAYTKKLPPVASH